MWKIKPNKKVRGHDHENIVSLEILTLFREKCVQKRKNPVMDGARLHAVDSDVT